MNERENVILLDSAPQPEWNFQELLEHKTGEKWTIWHINSHFSDSGLKKKSKFFLFPLKVLARRKKLGTILSYQQFYGLVFAFYCDLLHLKKRNQLIVTTFIYRPKQAWKGKLYRWFVRRAVCSKALDKIVCFSSTEPAYYAQLLDAPPEKFVYVPFGIGDLGRCSEETPPPEERFVLSVGKSNRDYDFLVDALQGTPYKVRILSDTYLREAPGENIRIYPDVFGEDYYKMLAACYCVVVPLADVHISAGQFVFLQSMMFGKPVITTRSDTVTDYITDGENGFIISKDKNQLLERLRQLYTEPALYRRLAQEGRCRFLRNYSLDCMAEEIGNILRSMEGNSS